MKALAYIALTLLISTVYTFAQSSKGKVLVILSSENKITVVKDRATGETVSHPTGFFLSELMVPVKKIMDAGYTPVFSNPKGNEPIMDAASDSALWFGNNESEYRTHRKLCEELRICGDRTVGNGKQIPLNPLHDWRGGLDQFVGVLIPGGHAPMEDLWKDSELGIILRHFHEKKKPTAAICHGPIALLSALTDPKDYIAALLKGDVEAIRESAEGWIYKDYRMTVFSTKEEQQEEPGQDNVLGGYVRFYPDEALDSAGGQVSVRANKWKNYTVRHKELLTGQNPLSDHAFASTFVRMLDAYGRTGKTKN